MRIEGKHVCGPVSAVLSMALDRITNPFRRTYRDGVRFLSYRDYRALRWRRCDCGEPGCRGWAVGG